MTILALDLGTNLGWCTDVHGTIVHGVEKLAKARRKTQSTEDYETARLLAFKHFLDERLCGVDAVAYERVVQIAKGVAASHLYGAFRGVLMLTAGDLGLSTYPIPVGTIKKYWTGNGNASKELMKHACLKRGFAVKDDNEADAVAIYHTYLAMRDKK